MTETGIGIGPAVIPQDLPPTFLVALYDWGLDVIRAVQIIETPVISTVIIFITTFGSGVLAVSVILFIYWLADEKRGISFGVLLVLAAWVSTFLKVVLGQPRPFNLDPSLGMITMTSYGLPSTHAVLAVCFLIPLAAWLAKIWPQRRKIIWPSAIFFILFISFTRLYAGVHFPTDLFAGWIIAVIFLLIFFFLGTHIEKLLAAGGVRAQNISAAAVALLMNGLFPQERAFPALFLGLCLGYALMKKRFPFAAQEHIDGQKPGAQILVFRGFSGIVSTAALFLILRLIFPGEGSLFRDIPVWGQTSPFLDMGHFIRYGLLGFWVTAGVPRLFHRMGLAQGKIDDDD